MNHKVSRHITSPLSHLLTALARRRSGIQSTILHVLLCLTLGVTTLLVANGGGPIFVIGLVATVCAIYLLIRKALSFGIMLISSTRRMAR